MIKSTVLTLLVAALLLSGPYKVDISQRNATVRSFSEAFTAQTGVLFSYESTLSDVPLGNLSLSGKESLETLLSKAFSGKGVAYKIVNNTVPLAEGGVPQ